MANEPIDIEYNEELEPLEQVLAGVKRTGDFFVHGALELPMPKVEIDGVGGLSFPVPPAQIAALIGHATRAPYGRGEATILDESVRKVWQVTPDRVRISGKSWTANFAAILEQVSRGLGCEGLAVSAELYKLLVYDTGGFFLAHRDTEKAAGMFGTLIVALPSAHRGGELVIRHAGREVTVDVSRAEVSEVSYAAFYADCEHEVRPITEGNRVCLVYNLLHTRDARSVAKGQPDSLRAPDYEKQIAAAAALLTASLGEPEAPAKIAWLLEHQYSPEGLAFRALKSADAARVQVLAQAAERAGCAVHLGIVHIEESGAAEPEYSGYRSRGWGRDSDGEEDDEEDSSSDPFQVIEVFDAHRFISQWRDPQDRPVDFGEIPIADGELLPAGALAGEKPDEQRLLEASGNEGATFERSYHRAALVLWRRERYAEVLLQAGVAAVLPYLKERLAGISSHDASPAARAEVTALARRVVQTWLATPHQAGYGRLRTPARREEMLRQLQELGDAALLGEFIAGVVTRDYDGTENAALAASARLLGAEATGRLFSDLLLGHLRKHPGPCIGLLRKLVTKRADAAKQEWLPALRRVAGAAVSELGAIEKPPKGHAWPGHPVPEAPPPMAAPLVAQLLDVLADLDAPALRVAAVGKFTARPAVFDPVTVLVPALELLGERDAAATELWEHCAAFMLARSGRAPEAPRDWRLDVKVSCPCAECRELQQFALDLDAQTHRFRVRAERRSHLETQIFQHGLDMKCVTDRKGSPQTLVCTKDRRSYQRRCEEYLRDIAALAALAELGAATGATAASLQGIVAARALAAQWRPA